MSENQHAERWFRQYLSNGKEFMLNSEYYGYSVKMNNKTYKYNHNFKRIWKELKTL
jgi:hypothetical protein